MLDLQFRPLRASEVEARIGTVSKDGSGATFLIYKDARVDMRLLDEFVGPMNWQRRHYEQKGNLYCSVGIYNEERKEWVWKDDCGTESQTEAEKGEASDSFKRACFNWGIGRELYTAPRIFIPGANKSTRAYVRELESAEGAVTHLKLVDARGNVLFDWDAKKGQKKAGNAPAKATATAEKEPAQASLTELTKDRKPKMWQQLVAKLQVGETVDALRTNLYEKCRMYISDEGWQKLLDEANETGN